ncbi:MAG: YqiA/YcfP family alpha/beta fold hydrolase [Chloroflexota bacterium]
MRGRAILHLHGFLSSARSTKARFFAERFAGRAGVAFYAIDFSPTPRDFEYLTVTGMINRLRQFAFDRSLVGRDAGPIAIIASSLGGLVAVHYANRFGGIQRMVLLAPVLRWFSGGLLEKEEMRAWEEAGVATVLHPAFGREVPLRFQLELDGRLYREPVAPAAPTLIVHDRGDETVPVAHSRSYAEAFPERVRLMEVEAGHDLNAHLGRIWEEAASFLLDGAANPWD